MARTSIRAHFRPSLTEIICLFVGGGLVLRYAWLMDDAYVYFRYVDNLVVRGAGLVWNPGEYVEGFSSPLWALILVVLRSLHLDFWMTVRVAGLISFAAFWWLAVLANRGLTSDRARHSTTYNLPLIYLSVCYGVLCYFTSGLESPLVLVMAGVYACAVLWPGSKVLQILLGISPLVRPELVVPFALWLFLVGTRTKRVPVAAVVSGLVSVGGYVAFRIWYYADLFPNTFHLKDELWIAQGARYLWDTLGPYWTLLFLGGLAVLYLVLRRRLSPGDLHRNERIVMLLLALPVAAYVVKIGGAPIHFKDLAFPFALVMLSGGGFLEASGARWTRGIRVWAIVGSLVMGLAFASTHPRQLRRHPLLQRSAFGHRTLRLISDAALHRSPSMGLIPGRGAGVQALSYGAATRRYDEKEREGPIQVESWCRTAYMRPSARIVHSRGLTEPFLARTPVHSDRPAHKLGLELLAEDIARVRRTHGFRAGAFESALEDSGGKEWMRRNLESIRGIEARVYNEHDFLQNLVRAFTPPEVIRVEESETGRSRK